VTDDADDSDTGATDTHDPDGVPYADATPGIRELFVRPIKGDGILGDVGIASTEGTASKPPLAAKPSART